MRGPETRLRKKIVKALQEKYPRAYIRKIHGNAFQNIGIADLLCSIEGYFFALEIKIPGKKATEAQMLEGRRVINSKGVFGVVTSIDETLNLVERGLAWHLRRKNLRG
jgi:hypothetical protein